MTESVFIVGAGGHGRVLASALKACGKPIAGFVDQDRGKWGTMIDGIPVLPGDDALQAGPSAVLVNGIGSTGSAAKRREIFERFSSRGFRFATVIHPTAIVAEDVTLAEGVQLMAGVVLQRGVSIGANSIVNTGSVVDHDSNIGDHCHIAPGCVLSGHVRVRQASHIGVGATVIQGISIGADVVVGAGSVVIRDVADGRQVLGVPAKEVQS